MKSFNVFNEELLQEAKKATVGKWVEVEVKPNDYAVIKGTAGELTTTVYIGQDSKHKWYVKGDILNKEGHRVDQISITNLKQYKTFENKWKKDAANFFKAPEKEFLKAVMTKIHDTNTKNFFYVAPPDDD